MGGRDTKEIAFRVMRRDHGVNAALETLPLGGKRLGAVSVVLFTALDKSGSDKTTAGVVCSSVGNTERSFSSKLFSITRYVVVLFSDGAKLISEPDFVRLVRTRNRR